MQLKQLRESAAVRAIAIMATLALSVPSDSTACGRRCRRASFQRNCAPRCCPSNYCAPCPPIAPCAPVKPTDPSLAVDPNAPPKVHALFVLVTDDATIGLAAKADQATMSKWFADAFDADRVANRGPTILAGQNATAAAVRNYCTRVPLGPQDTIFIHVFAHGAGGERGGHVLDLPGGAIARDEIISILRRKNPRLIVLFTDSCYGNGSERVPTAEIVTPPIKDRAEALFLRSTGTVNVNSCSPGELAWSNSLGGSLALGFDRATRTGTLNQSSDGDVTWTLIIENTRTAVSRRYQQMRSSTPANDKNYKLIQAQKDQLVYAFEPLPAAPAPKEAKPTEDPDETGIGPDLPELSDPPEPLPDKIELPPDSSPTNLPPQTVDPLDDVQLSASNPAESGQEIGEAAAHAGKELPLRDWTDNTGRHKTTAKLFEARGKTIRLLKDNGRFCTLAVERLSTEDRAYVEEHRAFLGAAEVAASPY